MEVGDLMTLEVTTCEAQDSLNRAAELMWDHDCGCIPVVDESSKVIGMLTDRDVCMAAYTQGRPLAELQVASAMSQRVLSCRKNDTVAAAERLMRENQIRRLPVVDAGGEIIGIISLNDLAREAKRERKIRMKKEVSGEEVAETLGSICESRAEAMASAA